MSREPKPLAVQRLEGGAARYVTQEGDLLDHICWRHYGREWGTPEAVLTANRGLASIGGPMPGGLTIFLPSIDLSVAPRKERRRLFD